MLERTNLILRFGEFTDSTGIATCFVFSAVSRVDEARRDDAISAVLRAERQAPMKLQDEGQIDDPLSKNFAWR
jgi:hypothetical protein